MPANKRNIVQNTTYRAGDYSNNKFEAKHLLLSQHSLQLLVSDLEISVSLIEEQTKIITHTEYLQNAIDNLPGFLKEVTILHYHKCLSVKQISQLINKPAPLVNGWLAHSIYWLKIFVLKFKPPE